MKPLTIQLASLIVVAEDKGFTEASTILQEQLAQEFTKRATALPKNFQDAVRQVYEGYGGERNFIRAIKMFRTLTGADLRTSKQWVEDNIGGWR